MLCTMVTGEEDLRYSAYWPIGHLELVSGTRARLERVSLVDACRDQISIPHILGQCTAPYTLRHELLVWLNCWDRKAKG